MLSRVAERVYWTGRYIERAESTARLLNAYTTQVMDLPLGGEQGWKQLVDITGSNELFERLHDCYDEPSTVEFLLAHTDNPSSILSSLAMMRENVRTTRDVLPTEAVGGSRTSSLLDSARERAAGRSPAEPFRLPKTVVFRCQQLTGLLAGTMSQDAAYGFVRIGGNLERADMTTRVVDSAVFVLMPRKEAPGEYDSILWVNVLKSLSAYQMYRQHVRNRVVADEVVRFLLTDLFFPRSVAHTLSQSEACIATLPRNAAPLASLARVRARIDDADIGRASLDDLHRLIDEVQSDLADVSEQIQATWFTLERTEPVQPTATQSQFQKQA
jgi:uncharacterized alpha-E superfamily protein